MQSARPRCTDMRRSCGGKKEGKRTRLFTEYYSDAERHALSWGEFKKLALRVGIGRFGQYSQRLLTEDQSQALHSLWGIKSAAVQFCKISCAFQKGEQFLGRKLLFCP